MLGNCNIYQSVEKRGRSITRKGATKWKQRAKQQWLNDGDKNTKFFHKCASQRRKTNKISTIIDEEGYFTSVPSEINCIY